VATPPKYDLFHVRRGVAVLTTCLVQTLNETDPTFQKRFLKRVERACDLLRRDTEGDVRQELELLLCVQELLTGWNWSKEQGKPFLED
jgi:hypothetical protein